MKEINLEELITALDEKYCFILGSKIRQRICHDALGEFIFINPDEEGILRFYTRNDGGSLCFEVIFKNKQRDGADISVYYSPESGNTYEYPQYIPKTNEELEFQDLFYIKNIINPLS